MFVCVIGSKAPHPLGAELYNISTVSRDPADNFCADVSIRFIQIRDTIEVVLTFGIPSFPIFSPRLGKTS